MIPSSHFQTCVLTLLTALLLLPIASSHAQSPTPLRKGDALLIRIDRVGGGIPEYREIVDSDGQIEMPFLGFLSVENKTLAAVETEMADSYNTARLSTNAAVHVSFITHFEPPPSRSNLVRIQDPRRPVPASE